MGIGLLDRELLVDGSECPVMFVVHAHVSDEEFVRHFETTKEEHGYDIDGEAGLELTGSIVRDFAEMGEEDEENGIAPVHFHDSEGEGRIAVTRQTVVETDGVFIAKGDEE